MTTMFDMVADIAGRNSFALVPSDDKTASILASGVAQTFVVPSLFKKYVAIFSIQQGLNIWVSYNGVSAIIPTAGSFNATASELNPGPRLVLGGSTISVITPDTTTQVGVMFYAYS